jgi:polyhydroxyalkanoate synthase
MVTLPDDDFDMQRSWRVEAMIVPEDSALQHEPAPRPLPLFLELVREVSAREPELARDALKGLALYSAAGRHSGPAPHPPIAARGGASLRDIGGDGRPLVLIPSLINPPHILDLDAQVSLAGAISKMGHQALLLDWGPARDRLSLSIAEHVETLLVPLIEDLGEPAVLLGYCLGGTIAMAAATLAPPRALITLACPWHFDRYPPEGREALQKLWRDACSTSQALGVLPIEVLQASFWSLDPRRTVTKFAELKRLDPAGPEFRRFVALEDWANQGDPLPLPAARELLEDFFGANVTGRDVWQVGGRAIKSNLSCPSVHFTADRDRIAPAETAPEGERVQLPAGHVGMVVGRARNQLYAGLDRFLSACR